MNDYINYFNQNGRSISYSDIIYNNNEYINFIKWFEKSIKPFSYMKHNDKTYSITLKQWYYEYDWITESKLRGEVPCGDGHDYEDVFKIFINDKLSYLNSSLKYDSENGMFCVYCDDLEKTVELIYELSCLYKDENKMIELIRESKKIYYEKSIKI